MQRRFKSKWANYAAQAAITVAALGLFWTLRPDLYANARDQVVTRYQRKVTTPKIIADYLHRTAQPKVQIGAGPSDAPGWLNTDIEPTEHQAYLDATKPLPFPDGSIYYIFGEHVIEHLDYDDALGFFKEAHRVLAPGGKIRMVTPNLRKFLALFADPDPEHSSGNTQFIARKLASQNWTKTSDPACVILNNEMHGFGHQFLYTPELLISSYRQAGFTEISQHLAGEGDPTFATVELRPHGAWRDVNAFESMAIEAIR